MRHSLGNVVAPGKPLFRWCGAINAYCDDADISEPSARHYHVKHAYDYFRHFDISGDSFGHEFQDTMYFAHDDDTSQ